MPSSRSSLPVSCSLPGMHSPRCDSLSAQSNRQSRDLRKSASIAGSREFVPALAQWPGSARQRLAAEVRPRTSRRNDRQRSSWDRESWLHQGAATEARCQFGQLGVCCRSTARRESNTDRPSAEHTPGSWPSAAGRSATQNYLLPGGWPLIGHQSHAAIATGRKTPTAGSTEKRLILWRILQVSPCKDVYIN